jgi:hypothetical protein
MENPANAGFIRLSIRAVALVFYIIIGILENKSRFFLDYCHIRTLPYFISA